MSKEKDFLEDKVHDKEFLKKNEFIEFFKQIADFVKSNNYVIYISLVTVLVLLIGIPGYKYYRNIQAQNFSKNIIEADQSIDKENEYKKVIKNYSHFPAVNMVRIKLAEYYLENQNEKEALKVFDEGLNSGKKDIFVSLMVFKKANIYKEKGDFKTAIKVLQESKSQVLPNLLGQTELLMADLYILNNEKDKAKKIFENLSEKNVNLKEVNSLNAVDSVVIQQAKNKLLQMKLGLL